MGIDIYAKWQGQTVSERTAQATDWLSTESGEIGYLREAYHGEPYATRYICAEAFASEKAEAYIRSYDRLRWLGQHDHPTLLSQIWGIDIAPFPAELAVINLFRQNVASSANFPRIACRDFFTLSPGDAQPCRQAVSDNRKIQRPI